MPCFEVRYLLGGRPWYPNGSVFHDQRPKLVVGRPCCFCLQHSLCPWKVIPHVLGHQREKTHRQRVMGVSPPTFMRNPQRKRRTMWCQKPLFGRAVAALWGHFKGVNGEWCLEVWGGQSLAIPFASVGHVVVLNGEHCGFGPSFLQKGHQSGHPSSVLRVSPGIHSAPLAAWGAQAAKTAPGCTQK